MKDSVMVARPDGLTQVHRMHGGFGMIEWKRMAVSTTAEDTKSSRSFRRRLPAR